VAVSTASVPAARVAVPTAAVPAAPVAVSAPVAAAAVIMSEMADVTRICLSEVAAAGRALEPVQDRSQSGYEWGGAHSYP